MATVIYSDLWVCQDCIMCIANDDTTGIEDDEREAEVRAAVYGGDRWVPEGPHEGEEEGADTRDFSWRPCACCGSNLGGSRHRCAVLGP
jgi:hypothetical protein